MKVVNKKILVPTIIGITFLIMLIIGTAYAYFSVNTRYDFSASASATTPKVGSVTFQGTNQILSMDLTRADMMSNNAGRYYASFNGKTKIPTEEVIGVASVDGEGTYSCDYTIKIDDNSNSIYDKFQSMAGKSEGQIVLTVNGVDYDFNTSNLFPKRISGTLSGISETSPQNITAGLKFVNSSSINQSALKESSISLSFIAESFSCEASATPLKFGKKYSTIMENQIVSYVFNSDGSIEAYAGDSLLGSMPAGTFTYDELNIYMNDGEGSYLFGTVSEDGNLIDSEGQQLIVEGESTSLKFNEVYEDEDGWQYVFAEDGTVLLGTGLNNIEYHVFANALIYNETSLSMLIMGEAFMLGTISEDGTEIFVETLPALTLNEGAFANYTLENSGLYSKDKTIFYKCARNVTNVVIADGVETIADWAFIYGDSEPFTVTIPASVKKIESLDSGNRITDIYYKGTESEWNSIEFDETIPSGITIHYNS